MPSQKIKVLIADDNYKIRLILAKYVQSSENMVVVAEANNGIEAVALCAQLQPDIVLMDISMPIMNGLEAIQVIQRDFPHTRVITLTGSFNDATEQAALKAGAALCFPNIITIHELINAITQVHTNS